MNHWVVPKFCQQFVLNSVLSCTVHCHRRTFWAGATAAHGVSCTRRPLAERRQSLRDLYRLKIRSTVRPGRIRWHRSTHRIGAITMPKARRLGSSNNPRGKEPSSVTAADVPSRYAQPHRTYQDQTPSRVGTAASAALKDEPPTIDATYRHPECRLSENALQPQSTLHVWSSRSPQAVRPWRGTASASISPTVVAQAAHCHVIPGCHRRTTRSQSGWLAAHVNLDLTRLGFFTRR
jgi:hypothetical protein